MYECQYEQNAPVEKICLFENNINTLRASIGAKQCSVTSDFSQGALLLTSLLSESHLQHPATTKAKHTLITTHTPASKGLMCGVEPFELFIPP